MLSNSAHSSPFRHRLLVGGLLCAWGAATTLLLGAAWARGGAEGSRGDAPAVWPADATISLATDRPTIVVFAHPRCPCTHATVSELARALAVAPAARVEVRLFVPEGGEAMWARTALWSRAEALHDTRVDVDIAGREAARFDARTSGLVLAYAPDGRQLFSGGITAGRGHEGDNAGRDALVAALHGDRANRAAVYGCAL